MLHLKKRLPQWVLLVLGGLLLLLSGAVQAQSPSDSAPSQPAARQPRTRGYSPPPPQFADPDRAADAAREATGGRVLGVQGDESDGRRGYRVRVLEPSGRVRNFHYDPDKGRKGD